MPGMGYDRKSKQCNGLRLSGAIAPRSKCAIMSHRLNHDTKCGAILARRRSNAEIRI